MQWEPTIKNQPNRLSNTKSKLKSSIFPIKFLFMAFRVKGVRYIFIVISLFASLCTINAQEPKTAAFLDGTLGVTLGDGFYTINIGGPSFSLVLDKGIKLGVGALPSLHFEEGKVTPKLGLGPRVDLKKVSIIAPFFPAHPTGKWVGSVGLAYKFGRKN